jgi:hypothetical protein
LTGAYFGQPLFVQLLQPCHLSGMIRGKILHFSDVFIKIHEKEIIRRGAGK